jgi:hypothetical protein
MSIYVLRSDNLIKIGFSDNLRQRVQSIVGLVPVPVEFVGHMPGDREVEKHFHDLFAASHFSGEWFVETEQMRALFSTILIPRMPRPEGALEVKRSAEKNSTQKISSRVRDEAAIRWPNKAKSDVVFELAIALGWSKTRTKDFYYADHRLALRAYEMKEVEAWLDQETTS